MLVFPTILSRHVIATDGIIPTEQTHAHMHALRERVCVCTVSPERNVLLCFLSLSTPHTVDTVCRTQHAARIEMVNSASVLSSEDTQFQLCFVSREEMFHISCQEFTNSAAKVVKLCSLCLHVSTC